jgi:hypothetical protein
MIAFLFILGGLSVMVITYLLMTFYMRRRDGVQPSYRGLLILTTSMACTVAVIYMLQRFGLDVRHGHPRDIFWLVLGVAWLVLALRTAYQRQSSGAVLMDLGPAPMFKLQRGFGVLMLGVAIGLAINPESRVQAFAYITWSVWFFVMASGRFQVRDRGIITGGLLPWDRITLCVAMAENRVRLTLNKGLQRTVDLSVPADCRDGFIRLVNGRGSQLV